MRREKENIYGVERGELLMSRLLYSTCMCMGFPNYIQLVHADDYINVMYCHPILPLMCSMSISK